MHTRPPRMSDARVVGQDRPAVAEVEVAVEAAASRGRRVRVG